MSVPNAAITRRPARTPWPTSQSCLPTLFVRAHHPRTSDMEVFVQGGEGRGRAPRGCPLLGRVASPSPRTYSPLLAIEGSADIRHQRLGLLVRALTAAIGHVPSELRAELGVGGQRGAVSPEAVLDPDPGA